MARIRLLTNKTANGVGPTFRVLEHDAGEPELRGTIYVTAASTLPGASEVVLEISLDGSDWGELFGTEIDTPGDRRVVNFHAQQIRARLKGAPGGTSVTMDFATQARMEEV